MIELRVDKDSESLRVDRFLRKRFPQAPLSLIYKSLRTGVYKVNDKKSKPDYRLRIGDTVTIFLSPDDYEQLTRKERTVKIHKTFEVLYEDDDVLIVNKPPMLASQPGTGVEQENLVEQVKRYVDKNTHPGLAHRLDRGTSGIVVIGKNREALLALHRLFQERRVEKYYLALVVGHLHQKRGVVKFFLKKTTEGFQHRMLVVDAGEPGAVEAETSYRVLEESPLTSLLELQLKTGKMHQIRAQFAHLGHPLVGDRVYGDATTNNRYAHLLRRQFLHAFRIRFQHPMEQHQLDVVAPLPEDLQHLLQTCGFSFSLESYRQVQ